MSHAKKIYTLKKQNHLNWFQILQILFFSSHLRDKDKMKSLNFMYIHNIHLHGKKKQNKCHLDPILIHLQSTRPVFIYIEWNNNKKKEESFMKVTRDFFLNVVVTRTLTKQTYIKKKTVDRDSINFFFIATIRSIVHEFVLFCIFF